MSASAKTQFAVLEDRGVVSVSGPDTEKLLGGLITNDMGLLASEPALYAALLSPQGKILFDFLLVRTEGGFLLDTARERAGDLVKRLSMYKLRASAEIRDVSGDYRVAALWGETPEAWRGAGGAIVFPDPRLAALGARALMSDATIPETVASELPSAAYHAHRLGLGVPEGGRDFLFGDTFPHEALLDQLHGVSFTKGCFVGQEVVSRMHHRGTAKTRISAIEGDGPLPQTGTEIFAGELPIGRMGSVDGRRGIAMIRLDRAEKALGEGSPLTADGVTISLRQPPWAKYQVPVAE